MIYFVILVCSFLQVTARSFQQRHNIHNQFARVIPTSYIMAFTDMAVASAGVGKIVADGWEHLLPVGLAYGTGGWMGCCLAMWIHNRAVK